MGEKAVFLDRDGTLNVEKNYVVRYEDWEWIPGAIAGMKVLAEKGFLLVVVSNQSGVGRGFYSVADVDALHARISADLSREGVAVAGFYYCPHGPDEGCPCRKPRPGLIVQAGKDLNIDLVRSYMVGDKQVDVQAAISAGVQPLLVGTGYGSAEKKNISKDVPCVDDLGAASQWILRRG